MQISIQKAFDRFAATYAEAGGDSAGLFVQVRTDRDPLASRGARTYAVAGPDGDHPFGDSFRRAGDFLSALEFATDVLAHRPPSSAALDKVRSIVRFTRGPSADMQTPAELLEDLVGAVDNLDERLSKGGALPDAWKH